MFDDLIKPSREESESAEIDLFADDPEMNPKSDWTEVWRGMPEFEMKDASPQYRITMNFLTREDLIAFAKKSGLNVTTRSDSAWFPNRKPIEGGLYEYHGPKADSRYPVCIPSKGRYDVQLTGGVLDELGVSHNFFVEEKEYDLYCQHVGEYRVVKMPFSDLGQGGIPARNFIWEWAKERGFKRHWVLDDNIKRFDRTHLNRRLRVRGGRFFQAMEYFVDRYENIAIAGPHDKGFIADNHQMEPFKFNSRVYSCILIDTNLTERWRGRYNEDTDLSLRLLKKGLCTLLFRALIMEKETTVGAKGGKPMKGGNTDNVYIDGDHRLRFAKSLQEQHPDVVEVVWKYSRWHHQVNYKPFEDNKPILRSDFTPRDDFDNYGMTLVRTRNPES